MVISACGMGGVLFYSASQDIVFGAYKTDLLPAENSTVATVSVIAIAWPYWYPSTWRYS
ncbi:hypothetical protein [Sodalis-like endosymbiont of Proechinophthirus fluctus]|uniref:hypothetical protein n=1 Tax=Sodalis-like endosymbiont of Proechinophthirus fluctus TaxID=1462730 RepID=UPI000A5C96C0|nr:hypothetical protein [Sodalis-like endosymbiont of Proechinophthirus fluctus]